MDEKEEKAIKWLKDRHLYGKILNYRLKQSCILPQIDLAFIVAAFTWRTTREGYEYWARINSQYRHFYYTL